jgi:sigma-B regulation protein RsbU (phosphoserine phosphatase)
VVEDSAVAAAMARAALDDDFACEILTTGGEAVERFAARRFPDLMLVDWELPDISGIEICRAARHVRDALELPILLVTARSDSAEVVEGLAAGANDYLVKPYAPIELRARARSLARIRALYRRNAEVEAELTTTLRSIGDAVISTDADRQVRFMNATAERLTGWSLADAMGKPLTEVFVVGGEAAAPTDRVLVRRDGAATPIEDTQALIRDQGGAVSGIVVVFRDSGDKQRRDRERDLLLSDAVAARAAAVAEREKLRASEDRLRRVVEASGVGLWDLDAATGIIDADPRAIALLGLPAGAPLDLGLGLAALVAEDRVRVADQVAAALAGHDGGRYDAWFRTGGELGPARWVESRAQTIRDADGAPVRLAGAMIDVTARKLAEQERGALFDALAAQPLLRVAVLVGPDLRFELANDAYRSQVAHGRALIGRPMHEVLPEAGRALGPIILRVLATGMAHVDAEAVTRVVDGDRAETRYSHLVCQPVPAERGAPGRVLVIEHDITETIRARLEVRAAAARVAEMFEQAPALVALLEGPEHRVALANRRCRVLLGGRDLTGRPVSELLPEARDQGLVVLLDQVRTSGQPYVGTETWVRLRSTVTGRPESLCLNFVYQPIRAAGGQDDGIFVYAVDVTELVQAREAARVLAAERQAAYEVLEHGEPVLLLDASWRVTFVNQAWEAMTGMRRDDLLGRGYWDVFPDTDEPAQRQREAYHRAMCDRSVVHVTEYFAPRGLWTAVSIYPTLDGGLALFIRDVTTARNAEAEARLRADFERQLIGIVSHDLRTPLSTITLGAQLLLSEEGVDHRSLNTLRRINNAADRGARLVSDLLDFTQARLGGGIPIVRSSGNLHTLVRQIVEDVGITHPGRDVRAISAGDGHGAWDVDRLGQVISNLVGNAIKYSPPASVIDVRCEGDAQGVTVTVRNDGEVLDEGTLARLFHPLQRGVSQRPDSARSVGLGLFIVKHLVEAHGGRVTVTSTRDTGTTFAFWVPKPLAAPLVA